MSDNNLSFLKEAVIPRNADLEYDNLNRPRAAHTALKLTSESIVAVHGLHPFSSGSNAFSTWTVTQGGEERNWLDHPELLPKAVPTARIMIFSYNSNAVFQASSATVNDDAFNLLEKLRQKRRKQIPPRPIIFICHSLGGLLVKRALCVAYLSNAYRDVIYNSTKGIVFFGTPHGGGQHVSIGNLAVKILSTLTNNPDSKYMEALRKNSLCSEENRKDFIQRANDFYFVSFIETKKTKGVTVVDKGDAILGLALEKEKQITVDASHTNMCKFWDPAGHAWLEVVEQIAEMAENAIASIEAPVAPVPSEVPPAVVNEIRLVPFLENTKFHGRDRQLDEIRQFFEIQPGAQMSQRRLILQGFPGIGKTTLALQYSIDYGYEYEGVFWVNALVADALDGQQNQSVGVEAIQREYERLETEVKSRTKMTFMEWCSGKKWLLVIDNLEEPAHFRAISSMIPPGPGHVLITSRHRGLSQLGKVMAIPPLDDKSAADLLCLYGENRRQEEDDEANALKIVQMLGCVPLAIRHCGCLVSEQETRLSSYIREFDDLMNELVIPEDGGNTFDLNESKPLIKTFEISLSYLRRASADAAAMLSLMANLEPTDISEEMLRRSLQPHKRWDATGNMRTTIVPQMQDWLKDLPAKNRGHGLEEALKALVRYSLLFRKMDDGHYFLHPLTHFWLRRKQDISCHLQPFTDAVALLDNGFPQPDFSRTYGLTNRHRDLRDLFIPHVRHLLKQYHCLKRLVDENEGLLTQLATLFLHASDMPLELRPMKQRVRVNIPGTDRAFPRGNLVDPFEQDTTFLPALEHIISRLEYPGPLFFHAMYVFFEHSSKRWALQNPHSAYQVHDMAFAGKPFVQVRARIVGEEPLFPSYPTPSEDGNGARFQAELEDIKALMPLISDPGEEGETDPNLDRQTGIIGMIALKYALQVRESVFEAGPRIEIDPTTNSMSLIMDSRPWVPGFVALHWVRHFKSLLTADHTKLCDLTKSVHAQLVLQTYQAKNDTGELAPIWGLLLNWTINAVIKLSRLLGPESVLGAESLYVLIWDGTRSSPPQAWIRDEDIARVINWSITSENFYFMIKLIDAWQYSLARRNLEQVAEALILTELERFLTCDTSLREHWHFGLDPVLDLYEYAIHLYMMWIPNSQKVLEYQAQYRAYFEQVYGTLEERVCLGCGVGVFGMRHSRIRRISGTPRARSQKAYAFGVMVFDKLKEKLGAAGSCLPNGDEDTSRLTEQVWCTERMWAFTEVIGYRQDRRLELTNSFGSASWNAVFPREDTQDDKLFNAEAERVKRLTIEAYRELFEAEAEEGMADGSAPVTEVELVPVETGPEPGPSSRPPADTVSTAEGEGQKEPELEAREPGPSTLDTRPGNTAAGSRRTSQRLTGLFSRVGISRKGKERAREE